MPRAWDWAQRWFDEVLVHGDPSFVRLEETFPLAADGRVPIVYTGYVTSPGEPLATRAARGATRNRRIGRRRSDRQPCAACGHRRAPALGASRSCLARPGRTGHRRTTSFARWPPRRSGASSSSATATTFLHCWRARACPYRRPATTRSWTCCAAARPRSWCRSRSAPRPSSACAPSVSQPGARSISSRSAIFRRARSLPRWIAQPCVLRDLRRRSTCGVPNAAPNAFSSSRRVTLSPRHGGGGRLRQQ